MTDREPDRELPGSVILEGEVRLRRESNGRVVVEQAPPTASMSLDLLAQSDRFLVRVSGNRVSLAGQVSYRVIGWDALQSALILEREGLADLAGPTNFPPGAGTKGA